MENAPEGADRKITLRRGIQFAFRHPKESAVFMSRMLYSQTRFHSSFNIKMRLSLASHILGYTVHPDLSEFPGSLIEKTKKLPLDRAVKLAVRYPKNGMKLLAAIVFEELTNVQKYSTDDVILFVGKFLGFTLNEMKRLEEGGENPQAAQP